MDTIDFINKYYRLNEVPRTGYVKRGISNPENVAEHTASCYFMAFIFLPDKLNGKFSEVDSNKYNKELIMYLLFIHDLAEVDVGDIVRGTKSENQKQQEYNAIREIIENLYEKNKHFGTPEEVLTLWADFDSGKPKNINAKIAKEIDYIQGSHRYFDYCACGRVKFGIDDCIEWLNEVSDERIKTKIGKEIRKFLIYKNPEFNNLDLMQTAMNQLMILS